MKRLIGPMIVLMAAIVVTAYVNLTLNSTQTGGAIRLIREDLKEAKVDARIPIEGLLRVVDGKKVTYRLVLGRMFDFQRDYRLQMANFLETRMSEKGFRQYRVFWTDRASVMERVRLGAVNQAWLIYIAMALVTMAAFARFVIELFRAALGTMKNSAQNAGRSTVSVAASLRTLGPYGRMWKKQRSLQDDNNRLRQEIVGVNNLWEITSNDLQDVRVKLRATQQENKMLKERLRLSLRQISFVENAAMSTVEQAIIRDGIEKRDREMSFLEDVGTSATSAALADIAADDEISMSDSEQGSPTARSAN